MSHKIILMRLKTLSKCRLLVYFAAYCLFGNPYRYFIMLMLNHKFIEFIETTKEKNVCYDVYACILYYCTHCMTHITASNRVYIEKDFSPI